jgi:hypothetical protein
MPPAGFKPAVSAVERRQSNALKSAATGVGLCTITCANEQFREQRQVMDLQNTYIILSMNRDFLSTVIRCH